MPAKKPVKKQPAKPVKSESGSVLINFILDKSGSMDVCLTDTIGGFNTYINKLKEDKRSKYQFSLTLFDTELEKRHVAVDLKDVPELTTSTYVPGGMTALHDAIGQTVKAVEDSGNKAKKVLTVILTDGQENSSREYSLQQVRDLITRKEKEGNWTFVFLGADVSAFAAGDRMGVRTSNSVVYSQQNVRGMMANTAAATIHYGRPQGAASPPDFYKNVPTRAMRTAGMSRRTGPPLAKRTR